MAIITIWERETDNRTDYIVMESDGHSESYSWDIRHVRSDGAVYYRRQCTYKRLNTVKNFMRLRHIEV